jgi:hypothetical protein
MIVHDVFSPAENVFYDAACSPSMYLQERVSCKEKRDNRQENC